MFRPRTDGCPQRYGGQVAYCSGIEDRGTTTVQVVKNDAVVWSYSVNKGRGQKNKQSLAEAIAKHLKDEYFRR